MTKASGKEDRGIIWNVVVGSNNGRRGVHMLKGIIRGWGVLRATQGLGQILNLFSIILRVV